MIDDKFCSGCPQHNDCKSTYEQLGKVEGPSVVLKSVGAFLVPILLFILSLGLFDRLFWLISAVKMHGQRFVYFWDRLCVLFIC